MQRLLAFLLPMVPFGFGLMRAASTDGRDLRYVWVAFAAFAGAMLRMAMARQQTARPMTRTALAGGIFVLSSLSAALTAWLLNTRIGPGMFLVAGGFALCFAAATWLRMAPRRS